MTSQDTDRAVSQALEYEDGVSLFELGSVLLIQRWRIVRWAVAGGLLALLPLLFRGPTWTSSASFIPQDVEMEQSGLRSLAGQFGVPIPGGGASRTQSPEFYSDLLKSRVILGPIVDDTLVVVEEEGERRGVPDLLEVTAPDDARLRDAGIRALNESIATSVSQTTGIVTVSVTTGWPSVSLRIAERLLEEVNRFNLQSRQSQAAEERRFVEERVTAVRQSLVDAERRLGRFLETNRNFANSPTLTFEFERLQREVALQQQVLVALAQSYEESRIQEVRDVPVITAIESPSLPVRPDRRGRALRGLLGVLLGGSLRALVAFTGGIFARRRENGDEEAARFLALLGEARRDFTPWRRAGRGKRSGTSGSASSDIRTDT